MFTLFLVYVCVCVCVLAVMSNRLYPHWLICPDMSPSHPGNGCTIATNIGSKDNQALKEGVRPSLTESEYKCTRIFLYFYVCEETHSLSPEQSKPKYPMINLTNTQQCLNP